MIKWLSIFTLICLGLNAQTKMSTTSHQEFQQKIKNILKGKGISTNKLDYSDPMTPPLVISKSLVQSKNGYSKTIIKELEELLTHQSFQGQVENHKIFKVGTYGGFATWRDVAYLTLGRAYYEDEEFEKAELYFSGVDASSPFAALAYLEKGWTLLKLKKIDEMKKHESTFNKINPKDFSEDLMYEKRLQDMFTLVSTGGHEEVISRGKNLKENGNKTLSALYHKIMAQAYFDRFVAKNNEYKFDEKINLLEKIHYHCESIPNGSHDGEFSFLAAESYWLKASSLRVKDPVIYDKEIKKLLRTADSWMAPWVDKSIKENKAYMSEEAMFFSMALLWEQEKYDAAVPRLKIISKLFPQGEYLEDTYQLLGDYYFDRKSFKSAIYYYRLLTDKGSEQKATYGVYKAAWSFYNNRDKWTALRHFERLFDHYEKIKKDKGKNYLTGDKVGLYKETRQDLLLLMGELLSWNDALKELIFFKLAEDDLIKLQTELGQQFMLIGKFTDAVKVWKYLLLKYPKHIESINWLKELMITHLNSGSRVHIGKELNTFYPGLAESGNYSVDRLKEFRLELNKIILTVHKEARRTDDMRIWKAVDSLYGAYMVHFHESPDGDIWYFGAQRQERLKRPWDAVDWYKKAAELKKYENKFDAALSALSIGRGKLDDLSLQTKKITKKMIDEYLKIADLGEWYAKKFQDTEQRSLARLIMFEALFKAKAYDRQKNYLVKAMDEEGDTKDLWNLFLVQNQRFYEIKDWKNAFEVVDALTKNDKITKKNKRMIENVYQETAFQYAFELDTKLKKVMKREKLSDKLKQDIPIAQKELREWYLKATQTAPNSLVMWKAWHNWVISYDKKEHYTALNDVFINFEKALEKFIDEKKIISKEMEKLLFESYLHMAQAHEENGDHLNKAKTFIKTAFYTHDEKLKDDLIWSATITFGSFGQLKEMHKYSDILLKRKSPLMTQMENKMTLSRLYFYGLEFRKSWVTIKDVLTAKNPPAHAYTLVVDLFQVFQSQEDEDGLNNVKKYLFLNKDKLKYNEVLRPLWATFDNKVFLSDKKSWDVTQENNFKLSSLDVEDVIKYHNKNNKEKIRKITPSQLAYNRLKIKLEDFSKFIKVQSVVKKDIKKYVVDWKPQLLKEAVCYAADVSTNTITAVKSLAKQKVKSDQWKDFIKKLNSRILALDKTRKSERKGCDENTQALAYIQKIDGIKSPLCEFGDCPNLSDIDESEILKIDKSLNKQKGVDTFYQIKKYLDLGMFGKAEFVTTSISNNAHRAFIFGHMRLALNDTWNAKSLFEATLKDKKLKHYARTFLGLMALNGGDADTARSHIKMVNKKILPDWIKSYYSSVVKELNSRTLASKKKLAVIEP